LLNLIATLLHPLLSKNSSELSLPLFTTAPFAALKKTFWCCSTDVGSILKNLTLNFFLKNVVKEKTQSEKNSH